MRTSLSMACVSAGVFIGVLKHAYALILSTTEDGTKSQKKNATKFYCNQRLVDMFIESALCILFPPRGSRLRI